ncbi:camphor resistance protein CrcB [Ectothiorhodosinus mongolicus]|uniref:Fluoride-specific ion channel FluC n=1 Tax=Ectothiorhodosinus mongolicus TaxID=233100 RepID=A0A1R3VXZ8_9GAMM|nr:CrcB family protein [Ectothiorhodosinus mongolicus]ULX56988.1 CrcB family protein [Ectothiorhodosinus mongolicus]SIT69322.1 camphor resistance protein CrcB [Ectothiorhodosinus mongolicus]
MSTRWQILTAVALGSALGAGLRYVLVIVLLSSGLPGAIWGTLLANVLGSGLIGWYAGRLQHPLHAFQHSTATQQFVMAGFCGGLTTFSFFSLELLSFLLEQQYGFAGLYLATSLTVWVVAAHIGFRRGCK